MTSDLTMDSYFGHQEHKQQQENRYIGCHKIKDLCLKGYFLNPFGCYKKIQ